MTTLAWQKSDGSAPITNGSLAAGTYYSEIPVGGAGQVALELDWDATLIGTVTIEATLAPQGGPTVFAAAGRNSWKLRPALGSVAIAGGSASGELVEWSGAGATRWRAKVVVTQAGVLTARGAAKGS
jgi:hypothetical protein